MIVKDLLITISVRVFYNRLRWTIHFFFPIYIIVFMWLFLDIFPLLLPCFYRLHLFVYFPEFLLRLGYIVLRIRVAYRNDSLSLNLRIQFFITSNIYSVCLFLFTTFMSSHKIGQHGIYRLVIVPSLFYSVYIENNTSTQLFFTDPFNVWPKNILIHFRSKSWISALAEA